jgi:hypothetical protein
MIYLSNSLPTLPLPPTLHNTHTHTQTNTFLKSNLYIYIYIYIITTVPELTEWDITANLDWVVERGTQGDASRDGGKERLTAKVIVKRKHYYYT